MHKRISDLRLDGFATTAVGAGEPARIRMKDLATSEASVFYIYAEQIANLIFPKVGVSKDEVDRYLVVLHEDDTADVFVQDFPTVAEVRVNRSVRDSEPIFDVDVTEIEGVRFPGAQITLGDRVVYFERRGWRFGILFDLTRQTTADLLAREAGQLQSKLILDNILQITLDALRKAKENDQDAFIITEGKTDWRHLQRAFAEVAPALNLLYQTSDEQRGDTELLTICKHLALKPHERPVICIFDRDNESIARALTRQKSPTGEYQNWGNNVFSMMIPTPLHRKDYKNISIEMYYSDEVLGRWTADGKRLCFDNEVRKEILPGKNLRIVLIAADVAAELDKKVLVADLDHVEDASGKKIGLSKARLAELISTHTEPFATVDCTSFREIAKVIEAIIQGK